MSKPIVTVSLTYVLDNDFWGIEAMLKKGLLSIENIKRLIEEDLRFLVDEGDLEVRIETKGGKI